jgi:phosphatidate phosphatase PAH1
VTGASKATLLVDDHEISVQAKGEAHRAQFKVILEEPQRHDIGSRAKKQSEEGHSQEKEKCRMVERRCNRNGRQEKQMMKKGALFPGGETVVSFHAIFLTALVLKIYEMRRIVK